MKDIIIESYIKMLKKEDLITFARKNGVELTSDEVNTIYEAITLILSLTNIKQS